jgi:sec-independent protein translocase protein TatC
MPDEEPKEKTARYEKEMTFIDHLEELRWRIIWSLIGIIAGAALVWGFKDYIMDDFLLAPAVKYGLKLQNLRPFGQVFLYMEVALVGGLILSIPNTFYQLWLFIAPGLYKHERKYIKWIVIFTSFCFLGGVAFSYYAMLPAAFQFFAAFGSEKIENIIDIGEYFNFILSVMIGAGLVFELPMVSFFLSKLGILTPAFMRHYRRHAIVVIFIASALLTPGTDPVSQILLAVPLVLLYEISIFISKVSQKKRPEPETQMEFSSDVSSGKG